MRGEDAALPDEIEVPWSPGNLGFGASEISIRSNLAVISQLLYG